jgi:hypothetical protein
MQKMSIWQNGMLTKWQVIEMTVLQNCNAKKWQVDKTARRQNDKLTQCRSTISSPARNVNKKTFFGSN